MNKDQLIAAESKIFLPVKKKNIRRARKTSA